MRTLVLLALTCLLASCSQWKEMNKEFENLGEDSTDNKVSLKSWHPSSIPKAQVELKVYYSSDRYIKEVEQVTDAAAKYISQQAQFSVSKLVAIVLDVDETALSNQEWIEKNILSSPLTTGVGTQSFADWQKLGKDTALYPLHTIYQLAQDRSLKVFFISERPESMREITELNLIKQGFAQNHTLILKPIEDENISNTQFKSGARRDIVQEGYKILANIGDQKSDLDGGYAERTYLIPNPFYRAP